MSQVFPVSPRLPRALGRRPLSPLHPLYILFPLIALFLVLSPLAARAQNITCGHDDGPGRVFKTSMDLGGGKTYKLYCVDGLYFEGEICCGAMCTPFGKCVFDGGRNTDHLFPGPDGSITKIVSYNWCPACGVTLADTARRRGETVQQWTDRVRALLTDRECDFNCYTWVRPAGIEDPTVDQTINIFRKGQEIAEFFIPGSDAEFAYAGGNDYLVEEAQMHIIDLEGQVRAVGTVNTFVDDFEDGLLDKRISATSDAVPIDVSDGALTFNIASHGDGIVIDTQDLHPMCLVLEDISFSPFLPGNGVGLQLQFSTGDSADVQFYEMSTLLAKQVTVKVTQTIGGVTNELRRKIPGVKLDDVKSVQIDWVPSPGAIDRVEIEITLANGMVVRQTVRSGLSHRDGATTAYVMRGLDITYDPEVSIGAVHYSDVHTDTVPGVAHSLSVEQIVATAAAPVIRLGQPSVVTFAGVASFNGSLVGVPRAELDISQAPSSGGRIAFTNQEVFCAVDASEISAVTDMSGNFTASFTPVTAGPVSLVVTTPDGAQTSTVSLVVTCAADWNLDGLIDSMDFFRYMMDFMEDDGDFNGDGRNDSDDFFQFLDGFFEPIPCFN